MKKKKYGNTIEFQDHDNSISDIVDREVMDSDRIADNSWKKAYMA
jgi:hypothetical protein